MKVILIGYMGSGKSSIGPALADSLAVPFVDLDAYIEQITGCSVHQLFDGRGEAKFRELEKEAMQELLHYDHAVIATGGGTPCIPGLMTAMCSEATVVYLKVDLNTLIERLRTGSTERPLLTGITDHDAFIREHFASRVADYEKAEMIVDANGMVQEVTARVFSRFSVQSR